MKTKIKILEIFLVLIAILLLASAVSAADENSGNDTVKISELETINEVNIDENNPVLESSDTDNVKQQEQSQGSVITQSDNGTSGNSSKNTTKEAVITSSNLKAEYHSGQSVKTIITDKNTGKGIETLLKVQYLTNGKTIRTEFYHTDSQGVAYITPTLPVGKYTIKISPDDENITAKTCSKTVTIVKTTTKITAKKVSAYKGYKITLKAVLSKTKSKEKIKEGKVRFKINGKTYTVYVKNGVATKKLKLNKAKTYKYTAQFIGNDNIKASKIATGKAVVKEVYATKITVKSIKGYLGEKQKYQIQVTTTSGKKVTSGQLKLTWNGKTLLCNVTKGVVKLVGTFGGNFKEEIKGNQYFYKEFTTKYKAKYIPTSLKYKASSAKYNMISIYKCKSCGKTETHTHKTNETTVKIYVI